MRGMGPKRRSRRASRLLLLSAVLLGAAFAAPGHAAAAFALRSLGSFDHPVYASQAPGSPNLVFVVEQPGTIRVLKDGVEQTKPFLDISSLVEYSGEQGLLSVAFDPDYAQNRRFYVFYVNRDTGHDLEVDQYRRSLNNPLRAPLTSRRTVITIQHNQSDHHNGGQLQFGPDGLLYVSTGDGGTQMDPEDDAQSPTSLLGKLLRIDPLAAGGYTSPATNPFAGVS